MNREYRICSRCIMDTTDPGIVFDDEGVCNHCRDYDAKVCAMLMPPKIARRKLAELIERLPELARKRMDAAVREVKAAGEGKRYDCVLGLSGGVDSSYLMILAKELGLRPLVVHMDNGWDSELAVRNVENLVKATGFDYFNHVVDWDEFRDLQRAYLLASVIDVEVVTDHAIIALLYRTANRHNIKFILGGMNYATEFVLPKEGWNYRQKCDLANLKAIHRRFGRVPLKTYPTMGVYERAYYTEIRNIREIALLNYMDYGKAEAIRVLERDYGWRYYGGKHYESVFTKFYQGYILPKKFGVDKRRAHLANLVGSGELTREEALAELAKPAYPPEQVEEDYEYVIKKLGFSREEFERIMNAAPVPHTDYPTERVGRWQRTKLRLWDRFWKACYRLKKR